VFVKWAFWIILLLFSARIDHCPSASSPGD
jgi:hypothetical protein